MDRDGVGGGGPINPTHPDWPDPHSPAAGTTGKAYSSGIDWDSVWVALLAEAWMLDYGTYYPPGAVPADEDESEPPGEKAGAQEEKPNLVRFLDPNTLRHLRTEAEYALEDAARAREWADKQREYGKRWRELAEDAEREAEKWREKAGDEDDPESRRRYEEIAEGWEKDARDRRDRAGSYDEYAEKEDERARGYQERHDRAVADAEKAVREAEEKIAAEQEAERLAREKAEQERIQQEREKKQKEWRERQARWARETAEREQREAEERRSRLAAEAWEKEFTRLDGISERAHKRLKEAEERLRREPGNRDYNRAYERERHRYNQAQNNLAGFMEGDSQGRPAGSPAPVITGSGYSGPSTGTIIAGQAQDKALDVTANVAGSLLIEGSTTAGRTAAGVALGQAVDLKTVYDLGKSANEVVDRAPEQHAKEFAAMEDDKADPMELRRHQVGHMGQRLRTLLNPSSVFD